MNQQDRKLILILFGLPAIVLAFFSGLYLGENSGSKGDALDSVDTRVVTVEDFEPFWRAWQILDEKFVSTGSTTVEQKIWGSISGLASSYGDPYTVFFPPEESKMFQEDISGNFEGVGMEIGIKDRQLQVVAPIKNSPAERAGVKTGDYILKISDKFTTDMAVDQAVKLIRGPRGTVINITFLTPGSSQPSERAITRDIINIPTIDTVTRDGVFIIKLYSFSAQSANLFRSALREFVLSGSNKLILDLRGNPGGYLDASWDMASWFLPVGQPVVIEDFGSNKSQKIYRSKGYDIFNKNLRMLILVDGGSASASEILAGALQEYDIAKLVGSKTFGKGSVQELVSLTPDTSLKITIARWLTPKGHNLSSEGLTPDHEVILKDGDREAGRDPVMDRALEILAR